MAEVDYSKLFSEERAEWKEKIQIISLNLKNIKTVAEAQVELFSNRQILLEYSFKLAHIITKLTTKERVERSKKIREYSERKDVKYGSNETKTLVEGDISEVLEKIDLVENHRKFIDQTIQTVDHMLYGIRQRIALEEYLRGGTIK
jgi:flagellar basal body rod protein FlgC